MGRVVQIYPDDRDLVHSVQVQTKHSLITRPISKLCKIVENEIL